MLWYLGRNKVGRIGKAAREPIYKPKARLGKVGQEYKEKNAFKVGRVQGQKCIQGRTRVLGKICNQGSIGM